MRTVPRLSSTSAARHTMSIQKPSDNELIALIAAGDKHAMALLFARHNVRVYRFIARMTGNASLAEDIVSEVFLDVWRNAAEFKGQSQLLTWLLAIARYKAMSTFRDRMDAQLDDDTSSAIVDEADDPETVAHRTSRCAVIRRCLMQLPPALREIIDLIYYHEKTVAEVAQIVGIPPGTVKTRMFHARSRLTALLQGYGIRCVEAN